MILHADLDAFYASVEQRDDPRLRGRPVIVGGGVVLAASYEAKAFGVRSPMGGTAGPRAVPAGRRRLAPHVAAYVEASRAVFAVFEETTPLVEGLSIDEAFLDVGGLRRVSGTPARDRGRRSGARSATRSAWPSPSGWPAPSSWPRWPAAWPSPTACSSWRPTPNWPSSTRCRCSVSGASGR